MAQSINQTVDHFPEVDVKYISETVNRERVKCIRTINQLRGQRSRP